MQDFSFTGEFVWNVWLRSCVYGDTHIVTTTHLSAGHVSLHFGLYKQDGRYRNGCTGTDGDFLGMLRCTVFGDASNGIRRNVGMTRWSFVSPENLSWFGSCKNGVRVRGCRCGSLCDMKIQAEKLKKHGSKAWLVNTGWIGGGYGMPEGGRIPLKYTRAIIDEIHSGALVEGDFEVS